ASAVVDRARGLVITPEQGEKALAARQARIEAVMKPFEDAVVYMLGEARQPGEEALAYFIRISDLCQPDFPTAMRERGFEPPDEDAP
ncbi:hypothetical protein, partial [Staphylococcus epidermidis]|uniref:hypothetical protein n=1 Tax=Staphylococcus epidermidis TaxID=1282 RepID=UPI000C4C9B99